MKELGILLAVGLGATAIYLYYEKKKEEETKDPRGPPPEGHDTWEDYYLVADKAGEQAQKEGWVGDTWRYEEMFEERDENYGLGGEFGGEAGYAQIADYEGSMGEDNIHGDPYKTGETAHIEVLDVKVNAPPEKMEFVKIAVTARDEYNNYLGSWKKEIIPDGSSHKATIKYEMPAGKRDSNVNLKLVLSFPIVKVLAMRNITVKRDGGLQKVPTVLHHTEIGSYVVAAGVKDPIKVIGVEGMKAAYAVEGADIVWS